MLYLNGPFKLNLAFDYKTNISHHEYVLFSNYFFLSELFLSIKCIVNFGYFNDIY